MTTDPSIPKATQPSPAKDKALNDTVFIETTDLVGGPVMDGRAEDKFREQNDGKTLANVRLLEKRHDIGSGFTYKFTADVK